MSLDCDKHIMQAFELVGKLVVLADESDAESRDDGCRVLSGVIRDCAYKIRARAEQERRIHHALELRR